MQAAEERYLAQNGVYTADMSQLDIILPTLQYFTCTSFAAPIADGSGLGNSSWTGCLSAYPVAPAMDHNGNPEPGLYVSCGSPPPALESPALWLRGFSRIAYSDQKRPWC